MYLSKNDLKEKSLLLLMVLGLTFVLSCFSPVGANITFLPSFEVDDTSIFDDTESAEDPTMNSYSYEVTKEEATKSQSEESINQKRFLSDLTGLTNVTVEIKRSVSFIEVTVINNRASLVETIILQDSIILREEVQGESSRNFQITTTASGMEYEIRVKDPEYGSMTIFVVESL